MAKQQHEMYAKILFWKCELLKEIITKIGYIEQIFNSNAINFAKKSYFPQNGTNFAVQFFVHAQVVFGM